MAFLIGMSENIRGTKYEVKVDRTTIGRSASNDIIIEDNAASAQHCYVARRGDRYILHDMNSTNGTCLNFKRVTEAELRPKQVIQIGSSELMFEDDNAAKQNTRSTIAEVEADVAPPVINPKAFSSISPYGTRRRESRGIWLGVIIMIGVLALAGVIFFVTQILR